MRFEGIAAPGSYPSASTIPHVGVVPLRIPVSVEARRCIMSDRGPHNCLAQWSGFPTILNVKMDPAVNSATEEAARAGFDINLIECNLALSVEERWHQHNLALDMALELQKARKKRDSGLQSSAPSTC